METTDNSSQIPKPTIGVRIIREIILFTLSSIFTFALIHIWDKHLEFFSTDFALVMIIGYSFVPVLELVVRFVKAKIITKK